MIIHIFSVNIFTAEFVEIPSNISVQDVGLHSNQKRGSGCIETEYMKRIYKKWILIQHRNMEYESIEKENNMTAIPDSGMFHSRL